MLTNFYTRPWSDLDIDDGGICYLCIIIYHTLKFDCDSSHHSGDKGSQIFAHLTL